MVAGVEAVTMVVGKFNFVTFTKLKVVAEAEIIEVAMVVVTVVVVVDEKIDIGLVG